MLPESPELGTSALLSYPCPLSHPHARPGSSRPLGFWLLWFIRSTLTPPAPGACSKLYDAPDRTLQLSRPVAGLVSRSTALRRVTPPRSLRYPRQACGPFHGHRPPPPHPRLFLFLDLPFTPIEANWLVLVTHNRLFRFPGLASGSFPASEMSFLPILGPQNSPILRSSAYVLPFPQSVP